MSWKNLNSALCTKDFRFKIIPLRNFVLSTVAGIVALCTTAKSIIFNNKTIPTKLPILNFTNFQLYKLYKLFNSQLPETPRISIILSSPNFCIFAKI